MKDPWLSVEAIAEYLGVSKDMVYSWVSTKGMPGHQVGRFWKLKRDEVDVWVRSGWLVNSSDDREPGGR